MTDGDISAIRPGLPQALRVLAWIGGVCLTGDLILRLILLMYAEIGPGSWIPILAYGLVSDLTCIILVASVLIFGLSWIVGSGRFHPWSRRALVVIAAGGVTFLGAVEFFFFEEFSSRFNHIVVDYLIAPSEVATNVWESYNVPVFAALSLAIGAIVAWFGESWIAGGGSWRSDWRARCWRSIGALVLGSSALVVQSAFSWTDGDRIRNEIAANSQIQMMRAFRTARLSFRDFYYTVPGSEATAITQREFGWDLTTEPVRDFPASISRERPLDIVVILEESLGSDFMKRLGGEDSCPKLEEWSRKSMLLTHLIANGNRTVRGLEGVLNSIPPLPGDSVWKRSGADNMATMARVLKQKGYLTDFFYGGVGAFDNMKPFALQNGWDHFYDDGLLSNGYPKEAFRTAWGAADEFVFDRLLKHQVEASRAGQPYFATLLTTSNHKPFLTPDTKSIHYDKERLKRYLGIIATILAVAVALNLTVPRTLRRRILIASGVVLLTYGLWCWTKIQPRDIRPHAVQYADRCTAAYLDQAEKAGLLSHTVVLIVGDHGARVYGAEEIPAESYRIPAIIVAPDERFHGFTYDKLCSQVDLAPTILSLAGISYRAPFFGNDLLREDAPERAFLIHNRDIGMLTERSLVVLGLQKHLTWYRRSDRSSMDFHAVPEESVTEEERQQADRAAAIFQTADAFFDDGRLGLPHGG